MKAKYAPDAKVLWSPSVNNSCRCFQNLDEEDNRCLDLAWRLSDFLITQFISCGAREGGIARASENNHRGAREIDW